MNIDEMKARIEALLFVAGEPLAAGRIAEVLNDTVDSVNEVLKIMVEDYEAVEHGIMLCEIANGYQFCTKPDCYQVVNTFFAPTNEKFLSRAALETLSVIALKQPVTRQEIEAIRGVKAERTLNALSEKLLITEVGRKEGVGRPILYGTTECFLQCFGLKNLEEIGTWAEKIRPVSE